MNSIDTDGEKDGYDLELMRVLAEELSIPVIASGGAGKKKTSSKPLKQALMQHWLPPSSTSEKSRFPTSNTTSHRTG